MLTEVTYLEIALRTGCLRGAKKKISVSSCKICVSSSVAMLGLMDVKH